MNRENIKADFASLHDAYAADYDEQIRAYDCYLADAIFGLCFEYLQPSESILDLGIGSGLSAIPFAKAGLHVHGMDFSTVMLEICHAKQIATDLKQHDLSQLPWPYPADEFDHVVCCGVLHFIADLETIFGETSRVLRSNGIFAFTTKVPADSNFEHSKYDHQTAGDLSIFTHHPEYVHGLLEQTQLTTLKQLKCFVGADLFNLCVVRKMSR